MAVIRSTYHGRLSALAVQTERLAKRMGRAQLEASSGLKVFKPSDAPGKVQVLHNLRQQRANQDVYGGNASWALSLQVAADDALQQMAEVISEARELAIQMSSDTYNAATRVEAAGTAQGLVDRLMIFLNTNVGGRYVFAGEAYDGPAYDPATGAYLGSAADPSTQVSDLLTVRTGYDGSALLQGGGDVVAAIQNLQAALGTGVAANVHPSIDELDLALEELAQARTAVGADMQRGDDAVSLSESLEMVLADQESQIADADSIQAYTNLFEYQSAYEAAIQVTANARTNLLFSRI